MKFHIYNNIRFMGTLPNLTNNILSYFVNFRTKMNLIQYIYLEIILKLIDLILIFLLFLKNIIKI